MRYSRVMPLVGGRRYYPSTAVLLNEVMKLMMPVTADVAGRIAEVSAEDGAMVEEGAALFLVEVSS